MTHDVASDQVTDKRMKLRYAGTCRICAEKLPARSEAIYERATKTVRCVQCPTSPVSEAPDTVAESSEDLESQVPQQQAPQEFEVPEAAVPEAAVPEPAVPQERILQEQVSAEAVLLAEALQEVEETETFDSGAAGSSARREYERRRAKDEQRLRAKWGRFGGIAVALSEEKQTTKAWQTGAVGEERLGAKLDSLAAQGIIALHDRRIPGSRANIDHIVITTAGIWVVDAKRYKGRPELRVEGGLFRPRVEKVMVGGRDCTKLVDGVLKQVDVVRNLVDADVTLTGALCFVEADWPLIGGFFSSRDVHVLSPRRLAKRLGEPPAGPIDVPTLARQLASKLAPA